MSSDIYVDFMGEKNTFCKMGISWSLKTEASRFTISIKRGGVFCVRPSRTQNTLFPMIEKLKNFNSSSRVL
jgi:hypothetical protein